MVSATFKFSCACFFATSGYNQWLLCGVLAVGLPDHPQCLFHEVLTLPHAVALQRQAVQCLALVVQRSVRVFFSA